MKAALVKILIGVVVYVLTFGVLPNWVGDVFTADAGEPAQGTAITVPAGTRILVRLSQTLNSANQRPGARFTGRLETNLMVMGVVAARGEQRPTASYFRRKQREEWRAVPNWLWS